MTLTSKTRSVPQALETVKTLMADYLYFSQAGALAHWDMATQMPDKGSDQRSNQLVVLKKYSHQILTSSELADAVAYLRESAPDTSLSSDDNRVVELLHRDITKASKLPAAFVEKFQSVGARGYHVWTKARETNDFSLFQPVLQELVDLSRERSEILGYECDPYDSHLDDYEHGLTVADVDPLFADLKADLVPLLQAIQQQQSVHQAQQKTFEAMAAHQYDESEQLAFCNTLLTDMGFDFERGVVAKSVHPFTTELGGSQDVRLTVRFKPNDLTEGISTALHEGGHAVYEQGLPEDCIGTFLASAPSLGIHESQSRLWENNVGKSRAYWTHYFSKLQAAFSSGLSGLEGDAFYRMINQVKPGFIRVESDEVTYNLHIMVRYELEKELINGRLAVKDLPDAWNARYEEYLGITPPTDTLGCLQDVHWSDGSFGYFPTYTLGNLYAAQYFNTAHQQITGLQDKIAQGQLLPLKQWLNEQIHQLGHRYESGEICQRVTGEPLKAQYFVDYLWTKYGDIYGIQRA